MQVLKKHFFGIQTEFTGIWLNNGTKLTKTIALRSEIRIENDFAVGDHHIRVASLNGCQFNRFYGDIQ
jgi:hypothetical protein